MPPWIQALVETLKILIGGVALGSIYVAYKTYRANIRKQDEDRIRDADKELLAQAKQSLEWAYNALTEGGKNVPPRANRLNWLTAARHLLRHKLLASQIRSETYRTVHFEVEEYWRHLFYLALDHNELLHPDYFQARTATRSPEYLVPKSAMVVIEFSDWPNDLKDPLDSVDRDAMEQRGHCYRGRAGRGLKRYVDRLEGPATSEGTPHPTPPSDSDA